MHNVSGSDPGTSLLGIGVGLGDGVGVVQGGSQVNVDGDLFVSVTNPLTGTSTSTGDLAILDTIVIVPKPFIANQSKKES